MNINNNMPIGSGILDDLAAKYSAGATAPKASPASVTPVKETVASPSAVVTLSSEAMALSARGEDSRTVVPDPMPVKGV